MSLQVIVATMHQSDYSLLDRMNIPSVLIECGFLSNPAECDKLCDEAYQNELAATICCAILEHID